MTSLIVMSEIPIRPGAFDKLNLSFLGSKQQIGEYTLNRERTFKLGREDAKYLHERVVGSKGLSFDLNQGFETFEEKSGEDERLDVLLEWIIRHAPSGVSLKKAVHEADIVCWRGLLTRIAATPYSDRDAWKFLAVRYQGVIFLCEVKTEDAIQRNANMTERDKMMCYWGFKFEQYMTTDEPKGTPDTSGIVSCREEFATVVRSTLGASRGPALRLLYSGEVDAIDRDGQLVEMKTQRLAMEGGFWRQKSLKWWIQSFLVGIEHIIVGFRNDAGIADSVECVRVDSLHRQGQWRPSSVVSCLSETLSSLRDRLPRDGLACSVAFSPVTKLITFTEIPASQARFLSDDFAKHFKIEQ